MLRENVLVNEVGDEFREASLFYFERKERSERGNDHGGGQTTERDQEVFETGTPH